MKFLNQLERKYGRYAIQRLPMIMIGMYIVGYALQLFMPQLLYMFRLEPFLILRGQVWRIVTWLIIPPDNLGLFTIIMLMFYYSIGQSMERTWGAFRFNVYILMGVLFTVLGAFILYAIYTAMGVPDYYRQTIGYYFSTYYINLSIFLAFAVTYPDMQVMLYFLIPLKVKWLGLLDGVLIAYSFIRSGWPGRVAILASLLNFIVFFLMTRNYWKISPREISRKQKFRQTIRQQSRGTSPSGARHKCTVCGRTELDDPNLEFRFCSKCDGAYEYCNDHLFTHQHIHR